MRGFNTITHYLAGAGLMALLFLTVTDILGRSFFSRPVPGTVELTSMMLVFVVFLAVAHSEDMGDHITIDLIYERVGPRFARGSRQPRSLAGSLGGSLGGGSTTSPVAERRVRAADPRRRSPARGRRDE